MFLSGSGRDIKINAQTKFTYERGEIFLVPIDYLTVELAGGKVPNGGVPMWFDTPTEKMLAKLNDLAK